MKKLIHILVPILLILLILGSIAWYLFVYDRDFTRDTLLGQARYHDLHGNSRLSAWFYDLAYEHSGRDENVAIELANQYKSDGNYTKAEYTLSNAINSGATAELYTALCKTYVEQDKLLDAVAMLANIADPAIKAELDALRPSAPAADTEPGFYSQYIDVALSSDGGTLYCTTDGEYPSIAAAPYSEAISLPAGETVIYAISVAESGLVSPLSILGYTVGGVVEPAIFMDVEMEKAMRTALGAADDDILYTNDLWNISEFTVPSGVRSLEDLKLVPYVQKLTVQSQKLVDLNALSGLNLLQTLDLTGCSFPAESLSVVASLPALTELILKDCGLSTIEGLTEAKGLTRLDLSDNTIRKLEPLRNMSTLLEINLKHNAVTSLEALTELSNLEKLDVSYNALTSLSPIASCAKLSWLDAGNNQLTSVEGANKLPLLSHLGLSFNKLTDVSPLASCSELVNLSIASNEITDISALNALLKLDILDFAYNKVAALPDWQEGCTLRVIDGSYNALTSIDNLSKLEQIGYVYMDYNLLTSVDAIANCYHLVQVNVYGNEIDNVSALTEHNIIVNYDPTK